jgi:hypothetical protein
MTRFAYRASSTDITAHLDAQRFADQPFERGGMTRRRPELQFRVARRPQLQQPVVATVVQVEAGHRLRMAAVEAFGKPQDRGERSDGSPAFAAELAVPLVLPLRRRLPVIPGDQRDDLDLFWIKAPQISILDQIVGMLVVALVADVVAGVMQERCVGQGLTILLGASQTLAQRVEQDQRQTLDVRRVRLLDVTAKREVADRSRARFARVGDGRRDARRLEQ